MTGVITTSFPRHAGDFAGCFVEDAVRAHAAAGEAVEVIAAGTAPALARPRPGDAAGNLAGGYLGHGLMAEDRLDLGPAIRVLRVPTSAAAPGSSLFYGPGAPEALEAGGFGIWLHAGLFWAMLCEHVRERAPAWDRIVAHWLLPSALAATTVASHLPLTAYAHSGDVALLERLPGGAALGRRLANDIDDLIFVSTDLHRRFARLTGKATGRVAPVAARRPLPRSRAAGSSEDAPGRPWTAAVRGTPGPTVLSVGRLVPIKGFDILLRAVGTAAAQRQVRGSDFMTVVILGDGPERERLRELARRMGLDLRLPGYVPRPDVARWMRAADCYVQPSRRLATGRTEGLPTATLEALQVGLPVIASKTGGLADIEGPGVRMVPPNNVGALSFALGELS